MALSKDLLDILACPKCVREPDCTGDLEYNEEKQQLICRHCKLMYLIKDDIPVMLIDDCLLYTSPSPRDRQKARMPSSA